MSIFEFSDYKSFLKARNDSLPSRGRGEYRRMALHMGMHTTMISQIMTGDKNFNLEHAASLAKYLGLTATETNYFLLLVQRERAGTQELSNILLEHIRDMQGTQKKMERSLNPERKELTDSAKGIFYSNWYYSAVRLMTAIPGFHTPAAIAQKLKLPLAKIQDAVNFLKAHGLIIEERGKLKIGPRRTHVAPNSPLANRHRINWRLQAVQHLDHLADDELCFSMPLAMAEKDIPKVTKILQETIKEIEGLLEKSAEETLACINIDWFRCLK